MKKYNKRMLLPAAISISISTMVVAEEAKYNDFILEEIIVTAQKRAESLGDVPISVSSINGLKMHNAGISNIQDISSFIPNFNVQSGVIGDKINIRGIQSGNQAGFEQSVAIYSDGVYRGRGTQSRLGFFDTERVEVLRGPQGTLFGKNTIAGAVNISTNKPSEDFEGRPSFWKNSPK